MKETVFVNATQIVNTINTNSAYKMTYKMLTAKQATCSVNILKVDRSEDENIYIIYLQSYSKIVCGYVLDKDYVYAFCTGTYSVTTSQHISKFVREFTPYYDYYTMKNISRMKTQSAILDSDVMDDILMQSDKYTGGELFGIYKSS